MAVNFANIYFCSNTYKNGYSSETCEKKTLKLNSDLDLPLNFS
jgi:hypothetical protein